MSERLTPRIAEVVRLYRAKWTVDGIADKLGISPKSVRTYANLARRLGHDVPRAPNEGGNPRKMNYGAAARMARDGMKQAEIGAAFGVSQKAVSNAFRKMRADGIDCGPAGRWPR